MSTDHDLEYGPTPPGAQYEHTDITVSIGYNFAAWLLVAMTLSLALVYSVFWYYEGRRVTADVAAQQFPLAAGLEKEPPSPRLQTQPFKDIYLLKQGQSERLGSFGWADKDGGIVHIPIEHAMELTRQQLTTRPEAQAGALTVVQDSSSGRTSAVR
jgi:hypothetical protein